MAVSEHVSDLFDRVCVRAGGRTAVRVGHADLSYRDLLGWSQACSRSLEPLVRRPGERVALLLPNSPAFVAAFYGIARAGGVVAPLSPLYRSRELESFLTDLDPAALITEPALGPVVSEALDRLAHPPALVEMSRAGESRLLRSGSGRERHIPRSDPFPLLQLYTSGSTGTPKKVVRTHPGLLRELRALRQVFDTGEADR